MKQSASLILLSILLLCTVKCAKRASPTGGPRDSIPPRLINASPKLKTTFFDKESFTLTFDEYITLKNVSKQLAIINFRNGVFSRNGGKRREFGSDGVKIIKIGQMEM